MSDDFSPRDAALEYWFWKFHSGALDFLVDFIVRRSLGQAEVRVSLWVDGRGRVEHAVSSEWSTGAALIKVGASELWSEGSRGSASDISWDLRWSRGQAVFDTHLRVLGPLRPADMDLAARPMARISGQVAVAGRTFAVDDAQGAVYHYGGRRLADRWAWVSATEFEGDPTRRVEAYVGSSRLWGHGRMPLGVGYLWLTDGARSEFLVSPINGFIRQSRTDDRITLTAVSLTGRRHHLTAFGSRHAFNDLGEGIRQTLRGDLEFDGARAVRGTVGLEFRDTRDLSKRPLKADRRAVR